MPNTPSCNTSTAPITQSGLTIFFPVHNEVLNLEELVRQTVSIVPYLTADPEILIIDDGSRDGSGELADKLAEEISCLRVIHHTTNLGYGAALQSGFRGATKDLVFYTDGDGQFDMQELLAILPLMETVDVISCYRIHRQDPWHRSINTRAFEWIMRLWFGLTIRDPDCAYKIYRQDVLQKISMTMNGAMIDVEMLLQAQRAGFRILQKGVRHLPRRTGNASGANLRVILRAFQEMFQLWRRLGGRFSPRRLECPSTRPR